MAQPLFIFIIAYFREIFRLNFSLNFSATFLYRSNFNDLNIKSGQRPPEVARLSEFFLYRNNANGEAVFEQFPIV